MPLFDLSRKPTGWQKWMLKAPSYLYRSRLGFVFGQRFLMVEHHDERAHPKTAAKLYDVMGVSCDGSSEGLVEMMEQIPMVAFSLDS